MRLALLSFVLGVLVALVARPHLANLAHHLSTLRLDPAPKPAAVTAASATASLPRTYPAPGRILRRLKQTFDEAVVVVLADESFDDRHQLVRLTVVEIWKGPAMLTGRTMDHPLQPSLSHARGQGPQRVLRFVRLTPHVDSGETVYFDGDALRLNPALTVHSLRDALLPTAAHPIALAPVR